MRATAATVAADTAENLLALALVGPWIACTTGWAIGVAAYRVTGQFRR